MTSDPDQLPGHLMCVCGPFGTDWFAYAIHSVGESPRSLWFATAVIRRRAAAMGLGLTSGESVLPPCGVGPADHAATLWARPDAPAAARIRLA